MTDRLVFAYAYLMEFNGQMPEGLPNGDAELPVGIPGYFVGNPEEPTKGNFEGRNNYRFAYATFLEKGPDAPFIDLAFE